jgi:uncharacterized protein YutE (UPF0331/DUF86 family)
MNTDAQKILKDKALLLQKYFKKLMAYLALTDEELLHNEDKLYAMQRFFQLVVDESIDINSILIYQLGGTIPDSLKSSFYELVPLKIIDQDFAERISESAKIRNQMTHDYDKLTEEQVTSSIRKFSEMYQEYIKILVEKFIKY